MQINSEPADPAGEPESLSTRDTGRNKASCTVHQYTVDDTGKIDFDGFGTNVDEHNFKSEIARIKHHLQVVFVRKCRLDRKALLIVQQLLRNLKGLTASRDRGGSRICRLDCPGYSIWIKDREESKSVRIAVRQRALTGTICAGDEGKGLPIHRDVACAG